VPSPFPGMDPYLEHPDLWPDVHHRLITAIADAVGPQLRPKYRVAIEKRTYLAEAEDMSFVGRPDAAVLRERPTVDYLPPGTDVSPPATQPLTVVVPTPEMVREGYLEVREINTAEVITVLELLFPSNKRVGEGRRVYELKRRQVLSSLTHLVEIDLLRAGKPMPIMNNESQAAYRILISRGQQRPLAQLYTFDLQETIPKFRLPLQPEDTEPEVDLQVLLAGMYERAGYDLAVDYSREPVPPLSEENKTWANALLRQLGLS
jgi:hypothetical protein